MKEKILESEKSLFKIKYISDKEYLNKIIDKDYLECGKSGILYNQKDTINSLLDCEEDRNIKIYNFTCEQIDNYTHLIHYLTKQNDNVYYRTSIWNSKNELKLIYHQATQYNDKIDLIEF